VLLHFKGWWNYSVRPDYIVNPSIFSDAEIILMANLKVDNQLNTLGLFCPEPVMMLHNKIRDMTDGEILHIKASDPSTRRDIPKFCSFLGHQLVHQDHTKDQYNYYIRKGNSEKYRE
jgi:tRNA 2-thiouridine synthesizing protein A